MRDSPVFHSSHSINNQACSVAKGIVKVQAQLATSIISSHSGMELVQWRGYLSDEVVCVECCPCGSKSTTAKLRGLKETVSMDVWAPIVWLTLTSNSWSICKQDSDHWIS
jgi:hypothetical protein